VNTYTIKWRDAQGGEHTHVGADTTTMRHYVTNLTALPLYNPPTLVSVTLDELTDAQVDDLALARVEGGVNP
jgi:hypothetical protein